MEYDIGPVQITGNITTGFYRNTGFMPTPTEITGTPSDAQIGGGTTGLVAGSVARYISPTGVTVAVPDEMASPAVAPRNLSHDLTYTCFFGGIGEAKTFTRSSNKLVVGSGHGLLNNQPVLVRTTGTLPGGLELLTVYYVRAAGTSDIELSLTPGGSAVTLSSAGTGTHSVVPYGLTGRFADRDNPQISNRPPKRSV